MDRSRLILLGVAFEGGMLALALVLGALLGRAPFGTLRPDPRDALLGLAAVLPLLALLPLIEKARWSPLEGLRRDLDRIVEGLFARARTADLALLSIMAGLGEEALFRGVIQPALQGIWGPARAVVATGALFGLAHFVSPSYALYAGLVGVYLGLLLLIPGNILVPIVVHAVYDFVALTWLVRSRRPSRGGS